MDKSPPIGDRGKLGQISCPFALGFPVGTRITWHPWINRVLHPKYRNYPQKKFDKNPCNMMIFIKFFLNDGNNHTDTHIVLLIP